MKAAVCVKHAVDEGELKFDQAGKPLIEGAAGKMGTFDKNAVEAALRVRSDVGGEVVAVTVGGADARKSLKEALAMGADRGVHVVDAPPLLNPSRTAALLAASLRATGEFDLVVCAEGSSDSYSGLVPPMVAERLGHPYVGYARKLEVTASEVRAERSLDESVESVSSPLPAVVSVVSEINEPRYPTLIQIMQASKKPVTELKAQDLLPPGGPPSVTVASMLAQSTDRKRVFLDGTPDEAAAKLVEVLSKAGVIPA